MVDNITGKNTKITALSDIIQSARKQLIDSNVEHFISNTDSRKAILICLLYIYYFDDNGFSGNIELPSILEFFGLENKSWIIPSNCNGLKLYNSIETLLRIKSIPNWKRIICYALEALEYNTDEYFAANTNRGVRTSNPKKKNRGIYYSPNDVVDFTVTHCLERIICKGNIPTIIDCSCGSGVFLLASLKKLDNTFNKNRDIEISLNFLKNCIWGIDISPSAIDNSIFTFIQYYTDYYNINPKTIGTIWNYLCNCFLVGDSTDFETILKNNKHFPRQYDCIIGNPPYVSLGKDHNLFIPFVDLLMNYTSNNSSSALVLPLSVCYSKGKDYIALRERFMQDCAVWEFHNFDRSPDSLFGDQIKTRNTIVFRYSNVKKQSLSSTKLQRWTSENRINLFKQISICNISDIDISSCIPKLSNYELKPLYHVLSESNGCLLDSLSNKGDDSALLLVNGTAYNWLCVYDHIPPSTNENGAQYLSTTSKIYYACNEDTRYFCLALLSNRIAYWFWITTGDGFHLNSSFLSDYRISRKCFTDEQFHILCHLGREYSLSIQQNPTVSYNAGKTIVNYSHWESMSIIKQIEDIILTALCIPNYCGEIIANWYNNHVHCGRKE